MLLRHCYRFWQQSRNVQYVSTLSKGQISFDIVAKTGNTVAEIGNIVTKNGNNVEATFDFV